MVVDFNNEVTIVEFDILIDKFLHEFVRDRLMLHVLYECLHFGLVGKGALLFIEAKEVWM